MVVSFEGHLEAWDKRLFLVWVSPVRMFFFRTSYPGEAVNCFSSGRRTRQRLYMWLGFRFLSICFMFVHLESDP